MWDFTYDSLHRETASDPDSSYAYTYDNLGEVTTSLDNSSTPNPGAPGHVVLASTSVERCLHRSKFPPRRSDF